MQWTIVYSHPQKRRDAGLHSGAIWNTDEPLLGVPTPGAVVVGSKGLAQAIEDALDDWLVADAYREVAGEKPQVDA